MSERWLRCAVLKGMFSDELAIVYSGNGKEVSFFVPRDQVIGEVNSEGKLKVRVFRQDHTPWAVVPDEYQTAIPVAEADLLPA
jgi:hypothetical protein